MFILSQNKISIQSSQNNEYIKHSNMDKCAIITTLCNDTMQYFMIYNGSV